MSWSRAPLLEMLVIAVSVVVGVFSLLAHYVFYSSAGPFFRDDAHEIAFSTHGSIAELLSRTWLDSSPVLYKLFLRAVCSFGDSDQFLRAIALSLACLTTLALFAYFMGMRREGAPMLSAAVAVLAPTTVLQIQALRPYGLGLLFMTLFAGEFLMFARTNRLNRGLYSAGAAVLAAQTSFHAVYWIASVCSSWFVAELLARRSSLRSSARFVVIGLPAAVSVLPYVPIVRRAASWVRTQQEELSVSAVLHPLDAAMGTWLVPLLLLVFLFSSVSVLRGHNQQREAGTPGPLALERRDVLAAVICSAIFFTLTTGSFFSSGIRPTAMRYTPLVFLLCLLGDVALQSVRLRIKAGLACVVACAVLISWTPARAQLAIRQSNNADIARRVGKLAVEGDIVLFRSWTAAISYHRYDHGVAPIHTIPDIPFHAYHRYDLLMEKFEQSGRVDDLFALVTDTLRRGNDVFVVGNLRRTPLAPTIPELPSAPHPQFGYFKIPYLWNSEDRVFQHLFRHARSVVVETPPNTSGLPISQRENMKLLRFRGWND